MLRPSHFLYSLPFATRTQWKCMVFSESCKALVGILLQSLLLPRWLYFQPVWLLAVSNHYPVACLRECREQSDTLFFCCLLETWKIIKAVFELLPAQLSKNHTCQVGKEGYDAWVKSCCLFLLLLFILFLDHDSNPVFRFICKLELENCSSRIERARISLALPVWEVSVV